MTAPTLSWKWDGGTWRVVAGAAPPARQGHALAFDPVRGRIVLFGGNGAAGLLADTWERDGGNWSLVAAAASPAGRSGPALAFDGSRGKMVLYGGLGTGAYFADTWTWDGTAWAEPSPLARPRPRSGAAIAWDERRGVVVLFGGYSNTTRTLFGDTWEWDGVRWWQIPTSIAPSPRYLSRMAYDSLRGRILLFGGANPQGSPFTDTWEWDGTTWTQRAPATVPPSGAATVGMAFDRIRGVVVLVVIGMGT